MTGGMGTDWRCTSCGSLNLGIAEWCSGCSEARAGSGRTAGSAADPNGADPATARARGIPVLRWIGRLVGAIVDAPFGLQVLVVAALAVAAGISLAPTLGLDRWNDAASVALPSGPPASAVVVQGSPDPSATPSAARHTASPAPARTPAPTPRPTVDTARLAARAAAYVASVNATYGVAIPATLASSGAALQGASCDASVPATYQACLDGYIAQIGGDVRDAARAHLTSMDQHPPLACYRDAYAADRAVAKAWVAAANTLLRGDVAGWGSAATAARDADRRLRRQLASYFDNCPFPAP